MKIYCLIDRLMEDNCTKIKSRMLHTATYLIGISAYLIPYFVCWLAA